MTIFVCERSVEGILSSLFVSFTERIVPEEVVEKSLFQPRLDAKTREITNDSGHAERVKNALVKYGGDDVIAHLKVCLLSCDFRAMTFAFRYARLILSERSDVSERFSDKTVSDFSYAVQRVLHERHIVSGFLRFVESDMGVMYAAYSPDNDITELLVPHFFRRFGRTKFIIHDLSRGKIAMSNGVTVKFEHADLPAAFAVSDNEKQLNKLWVRYFREINIVERKNTRQQDRFFPRRYRKYSFETWE